MAHKDLLISVRLWMVIESNGMELHSATSPTGLGA